MNKTVTGLSFIMALLLSALAVTQLTNVASANFIQISVPEHNIEIKVDGSVVGTDKIQCNDTLYTFTEDINGSIVVFIDNIVIDGAGHALQGNGTSVGFFLQGRKNVTVRNVRIRNFTYGIALVPDYESWPSFNYEFVIQGNTIANTSTGIYDLFAQDLTISGNVLRDNENGVFCWDTENLLVCGNSILRNGIGIKILDCQGSIYQNNFINNTLQINSDGGIYGNDPSNIVWHNGRKGNYWSDYNGTDANHDGVGDDPHIFDVDYVDKYPFMYPWGPPPILMIHPENETYPTSNVPLNFTVGEPTSWIGYSLDGSDNVTVTGNTTLSGLSTGLHNLTLYAADMYGNIGASETIHFSIEPFPTTLVVATSGLAVAIIGISLLVYFKKRKKSRGTQHE